MIDVPVLLAVVTVAAGPTAGCADRSEATFPGAYSDPANLVVGPFALVGAAWTPPSVVREFGGNKFPALVRGGHRVTVALTHRARRGAGLAYGPMPQGEVRLRDAHRVVTFTACRKARTFWSGFVVARGPRCLRLRVWVDDEPGPRRVSLPLGARCRSPAAHSGAMRTRSPNVPE